MPASWLLDTAAPPIRWRLIDQILPMDSLPPADVDGAFYGLDEYRLITQINTRQQDSGTWGSNILGFRADRSLGVRGPGTVFHYRRLVECGVPQEERALRLANRPMFRILSRDPDPSLLYEYRRFAGKDPTLIAWCRELLRQGTAVALAHGGFGQDPRIRGAAQRLADPVSHYLRSEVAETPLQKRSAKWVIDATEGAITMFAVEILAYITSLQRERAGLTDRLVSFVSRPPPQPTWSVKVGDKTLPGTWHLAGDPIEIDRTGRPADIPFALYWLELMARLGVQELSEASNRALQWFLAEVDQDGIWNPKGLRSFPKSASGLGDFAMPLEIDSRSTDKRKTDVTFRLALIAKIAGADLSFV